MSSNDNFGCKLEASSVLNILSPRNAIPYVIPSYQRPYRWGKEETGRLLSDICSYYVEDIREINANPEVKDSHNAKFVGTIIVVGEEGPSSSIKNVESVIDGQQRLLTFSLLYLGLTNSLLYLCNQLLDLKEGANDNQINQVINHDLQAATLGAITRCLWTDDGVRILPNVGREGLDDWENEKFTSPVPVLALKLSSSVFSFRSNQKKYENINELHIQTDSYKFDKNVDEVLDTINVFIELILEGLNANAVSDYAKEKQKTISFDISPDDYPKYEEIEKYSQSRQFLSFPENTNQLAKKHKLVEKAARLISLIQFINSNVYIAKVTCRSDNYLDIFESLNTAGRPLSPIETFIPEVYKFFTDNVKDPSCSIAAPTITIFDGDSNLSKIGNSDKTSVKELLNSIGSILESNNVREKDVVNMVISFALIYDGKKCGTRAADQRQLLKKSFIDNAVKYFKECSSSGRNDATGIGQVVNYLQVLYHTVRWWSAFASHKSNEDITEILTEFVPFEEGCGADEKLVEEARFSLLVMRESGLTLAQTISCRFYIQYILAEKGLKAEAYKEFLLVVRALLGFSAIWLSSVESTTGIEGKFRETITGRPHSNQDPLCAKIIRPDIIKAEEVINRLREALIEKFGRKNIFNSEMWGERIATSIMKRDTIARFMLLSYWRNSEPDPQALGLRRSRRADNSKLELYTVTSWKKFTASQFDLEHIIPQTETDDWSNSTLGEGNRDRIVLQLGNLTLLPKSVNRFIKNSNWDTKALAYKALTAKDQPDIDELWKRIKGARSRKSFEAIIKDAAEDTVTELADPTISWTPQFVANRSKRIAQLVWSQIADKSDANPSPFIDLTSFAHQKTITLLPVKIDEQPRQVKEDNGAFGQHIWPISGFQTIVEAFSSDENIGSPDSLDNHKAEWLTKDGQGILTVSLTDTDVRVECPTRSEVRVVRNFTPDVRKNKSNIFILKNDEDINNRIENLITTVNRRVNYLPAEPMLASSCQDSSGKVNVDAPEIQTEG